jgi:anti-anti-sigma factor
MTEPDATAGQADAAFAPADSGIRVSGSRVVCRGALERPAAAALHAALVQAGESGEPIVLDLSAVEYMDSRAVSLLFDHPANLELVLSETASINKVLKICGFSRLPSVRVVYRERDAAHRE